MIERIYNIIFWRIYSFLRGASKMIDGINPFRWLLQIPIIKNFYIRRGSSVEQIEAAADHVTNDPVLGINIWFANHFMMLTLFFWLLNCNMPLFNYIGRRPIVPIIWIADVLLIFIAHWCFVWRKDKYLKYFKKFEKQPLSWRIKWGIISFLFVIIPILLLFIGPYSAH